MNKPGECILSRMSGYIISEGTAGAKKALAARYEKDPSRLAKVAAGVDAVDRLTQTFLMEVNPTAFKGNKWVKRLKKADAIMGTDVAEAFVLDSMMRPSEVLGEDVFNTVKKIREAALKDGPLTYEQWVKTTKQSFDALEASLRTRFSDRLDTEMLFQDGKGGKKPLLLGSYIDDYMDELRNGGQMYAYHDYSTGGKLTKNVTRNILANSGSIAVLNAAEYMTKAMPYALLKADNPAQAMMALTSSVFKTLGETGPLTPFKRLSKLEKAGVYAGLDDPYGPGSLPGLRIAYAALQKKFGLNNIVEITDNSIKNLFWNLGEELGIGGQAAITDNVFTYEFGNAPRAFWRSSNSVMMSLQRFGMGQMRWFGDLARSAAKGNVNAMMGLVAAAAIPTMLFGTEATVGGGILGMGLPQQLKDWAKETDEAVPFFDLVDKTFKTDMSKLGSPLTAPSLGVAASIATQSFKSMGSSMSKMWEGIAEGDPAKAAVNFGLLMSLGMSVTGYKVLGTGYTQATFRALRKEMEESYELKWDRVLDELLQELRFKEKTSE